MTPDRLKTIYRRLSDQHGTQYWWPADSPFEVMVGAILTQNTAWTNVERAIANLKAAEMLSAPAITHCSPERLAELIHPSGYYNVKAGRLRNLCGWYLAAGGVERLREWTTDALRDALLAVKGVGAETCDDILLYAFDRPVFVIDAYTRRVFSRLGEINGDEGYERLRSGFETGLGPDRAWFAQYHALIVMHGKDICRQKPRCGQCTLARHCPLGRQQMGGRV